MIEWNSFYGAILIDEEYNSSKDFIKKELLKKDYFYFHPDIFSTGIQELPFYYDNILFSFGRTAKYFASTTQELQDFILEFEDILQHLGFRNAEIRIDTDYARYDLFWRNKSKMNDVEKASALKQYKEDKIKCFEGEQFVFGIGEIDLFTGYVDPYDKEKLWDFENRYKDFKYPF